MKRPLIVAASTAALALLATTLAAASWLTHEPRTSALDPIVVTRSAANLPTACRPGAAARQLQRLFDAWTRGDSRRFIAAFSVSTPRLGEPFRWLSIYDGVIDSTATTKRALTALLARRHAQKDAIRLRRVDIVVDRGRGVAAMGVVATRTAEDLPKNLGGTAGIIEGKAELSCRTRTVHVMSLSMEPAAGRYPHPLTGRGSPCPTPKGWNPVSGPVVACIRR